jgi:phosphoglycerate dehydrogenase-like enzyme
MQNLESLIINTARGEVIDAAALPPAFNPGHLGGTRPTYLRRNSNDPLIGLYPTSWSPHAAKFLPPGPTLTSVA